MSKTRERRQLVPESFFEDELITEVIGVVKSGKEATVYCCRAHPNTGVELLAAKTYRDRDRRSFKNDAVYQEGRVVLDRRARRAVESKTRFGRETQAELWKNHEFTTLHLLHAAGSDVPRPFAADGNALLIEYFGEPGRPAPILHEVDLGRDEARELFEQLLRNIDLWLTCNQVHGDLSPYNILYTPERLVIIDFPQSIDPRLNPNGYRLLQRDVESICHYFSEFGVRANPHWITRDLWQKHGLPETG